MASPKQIDGTILQIVGQLSCMIYHLDIPSRLLTEYKVLQDIEGMFVEFNVRNKMSWNEHIYDLKIKNFISWSQLGHILSSKNMGASALGCKML